jgi:cytochrome c-type biogenesis protein CcmF
LIYEALTDGKKISVGPPYFNTVFVPVAMLLFMVMAIGPASRWRRTPVERFLKKQLLPWGGSFAGAALLVFLFAPRFEPLAVLVVGVAAWITLGLIIDWVSRVRHKSNRVASLFRQPVSYYGMLIGHLGIAVSMTGICLTVYYSEEKDIRMAPGDVVELSGYEVEFVSMKKVVGPNYEANQGEIKISRDSQHIVTLHPQKRFYETARNMMTEADIDPGLFRDLYVALGEPIGGDAWAVRVQFKPFVRWVWFGGLFIALSGIVTVLDKRYRSRRRVVDEEAGRLQT